MTNRLQGFVWLLVVACTACAPREGSAPAPQVPSAPLTAAPPVAEQRPFSVVSPAGTRVDEYYWLRDDRRENADVLAYIAAENAHKDALLAPLRAGQRLLFDEIVARIAQDDASVPVRKDGYYYYTRFVTGGEYPIYARKKGTLDAKEQITLDANVAAKGSSYFKVSDFEVSSDGRMLAWAEDTTGRRQHIIKFKNLETGAVLPDQLSNAESSLAWANDHKTLLYIEKHPETLLGYRVRKHVLGSDAASDGTVYEEKDHGFYLDLWKSRSGRYLNIYARSTVASEQWVADASDSDTKLRVLLPRERDHEYYAEDFGERWVVRTNFKAPNFRIVEAPMASLPARESWVDLVPHPPAGFVEDFAVFRGFLAYVARADGLSSVRYKRWDNSEEVAIAMPDAAYSATLGDNPEVDSETLRFVYSSLTTPMSVYDYDLASGERTLKKRDPVLGGFSPENYTSEYVKAKARDGALVPVSIVYRKDVKREGRNPLYLSAYGSYGASNDPYFTITRLSLLDRGVVFAIAHVRGGQELGRSWYDQGRLLNKRNTFNDFVDVTDFLVAQGYAQKDRVAAMGGSAGGLLMGAIANMAPDRYRVIAAHVPFVDVVTTMLDESIPLTTNEFDEWGNPKQKAFYDYMLAYSPYDNVRAQAYPAMFVTTGLWDSQVQYYEPLKWVARLRAKKTDQQPLILRVNMDAGHGGKSGRFVRQEQTAEEYAFVLSQLGVPVQPLSGN